MRQIPHVEGFTRDLRRRLNRHRFYSAMLWTIAVSAAVMVVVALWYVLPGHSVPLVWYTWIGGAALTIGLLAWTRRRISAETAARMGDKFYDLQDAVVSSRHFSQSGKEGGFYELQARQTEDRVAGLSATAVPYQLSWSLAGCALLLVAIAATLGFKSPSERVQQELAQRQQMLRETAQINEELESLIEELERQVEDTQEAELIDADELRKWVDALEETTDRKEALRQYAHLEQKLQEASSRLEQRRDERLLDRAAKELEQDRDTKKLAKDLQQKKYKQAADELEKLKPDSKQLSKQQQELARLKAAAGRMTAAARALKRGSGDKTRKPGDVEAGELDDEDVEDAEEGEDGDLDELIEDLDEAVENWEKALEKDSPEECENCRGAVKGELNRLGEKLKRLALKRKVRNRLKKLCRACSECQSGLCKSPNAGGHKAGEGSNTATRDERDERIDNEQYTRLKGVKGSGPSLTKVEAAEDGDGVSARRGSRRNRTFERQIESFVQREDVPEDVKAGVKEYFKNIHQIEPAAVANEPEP